MAPRSFWKGYLKLSLVTCPVRMTPATTDSAKIKFHTLNRQTGNRVLSRYIDGVTGKPVREADEAKGYPQGEEEVIIIDDKDLAAVALETTRTIDIETFVPLDSIGWVFYDRPHYLSPADRMGEEAFAVIREAMADTGTAGIARLVMYRRERAVLLRPQGRGITLWTLRYGDEVREAEDYFAALSDEKPSPALQKLIGRLIAARKEDWTPAMVRDPVQERLLKIIAAKKKHRRPPRPAKSAPAADGNVVSIMEALKKSLAAEKDRPG